MVQLDELVGTLAYLRTRGRKLFLTLGAVLQVLLQLPMMSEEDGGSGSGCCSDEVDRNRTTLNSLDR